jgi:ABC-2 type transport system ATP-binding protein
MDEPTENLDPDTRDIFYAILNKISKQWKSTIFVSTHNLDEIRNYINYLVIIVNGEIKEVKDYKKSEDIHKIYNKYKPKVKI